MKVYVIKGITSKGTYRSKDMYKKMVEYIKIAIENTPKNVGIFAASYDILNGLINAGIKDIMTKKKFYIEND